MALAIDVVSDVICPWCFIGARRLQAAIAARPALTVELRFHPFLLDPSTPPEGADLRERLRAKYGGDPAQMFARVEQEARASGIPLDFEKVRRTPPTLGAHTLIRHALGKGTQAKLVDALFAGYFLEGRDLGDRGQLADIAALHGFTRAEALAVLDEPMEAERTRSEAESLRASGVRGVPFTILGGKLALSGAQPEATFRDAIDQALAA